MALIRVKAVVVDTQRLTIYTEDGRQLEVPQGDPRIQEIISTCLPVVAQGLVAELEFDDGSEETNAYADFEEKAGGGIRFFRVLKRKIASALGITRSPEQARVEAELQLTDAVESEAQAEPAAPAPTPSLEPDLESAVEDIIAHAEPVSSEGFREELTTDNHTIVAVVDVPTETGGTQSRAVPGVEKIRPQFAHAAKLGSPEGVRRFLERLGAIIDQRQHSVEDVLRFMERGDLPIADDGSILAYKRLFRRKDSTGAYFVDPHTKKVRQRVGSYVCVAEELVDRNRGTECSNGLHIGRRGYMGSFSGDVLTLCKIAPEDVIVVPHRDPNKVRVCGYHIIAELSDAQFSEICKDKPMTTDRKGENMLARAIRGEHVGRLEEVRITQQSGGGLVVTPLDKDGRKPARGAVTAPNATALDDPRNLPPAKRKAEGPSVPAEEVVSTVQAIVPAPAKDAGPDAGPAATGGPRLQRARELMAVVNGSTDPQQRLEAAEQLFAHKKSTKVGWKTLGIDDSDLETITKLVKSKVDPKQVAASTSPGSQAKPGQMSQEEQTEQEKVVSAIAPLVEAVSEADEPNEPDGVLNDAEVQAILDVAADLSKGTGTRRERAEGLFETAADGNRPLEERRQALADLRQIKATARVAWDSLGLVQGDVQMLINALGQLSAGQAPILPTAEEVLAVEKKDVDPKPEPKPRTPRKPRAAKTAPVEKPAKARPQPNKHLAKTAAAGKRMAEAKAGRAAKKTAKVEAPATSGSTSGSLTKAQEARQLFDAGDLEALKAFKRRVKKGWDVLGFSASEIKRITG